MVWKNHPVTSRRQARLRRSNSIWERARHDTTNGLSHVAARQATNHALARYDVIIYVFRLHSLLGMAETDVKCVKLKSDRRSRLYTEWKNFIGFTTISVRKGRSRRLPRTRHGEVGDVADFLVSCRGDVTGLSRTSRGSRRNGIWAYCYRSRPSVRL